MAGEIRFLADDDLTRVGPDGDDIAWRATPPRKAAALSDGIAGVALVLSDDLAAHGDERPRGQGRGIGREVLFQVRTAPLGETAAWLSSLAAQWDSRLADLKARAEQG